jgi:hypothetical protein
MVNVSEKQSQECLGRVMHDHHRLGLDVPATLTIDRNGCAFESDISYCPVGAKRRFELGIITRQ